jgi:hypothetical protein
MRLIERSTCYHDPVDVSVAEAVIRTFVIPERQSRYESLLQSKRGRKALRSELPHFRSFNPRFIVPIAPSQQTPVALHRILQDHGAPELCSVISENDALDGREVPLRNALGTVVGSTFGTILICLPGKLAYYEGEEPGFRFILRKVTTPKV